MFEYFIFDKCATFIEIVGGGMGSLFKEKEKPCTDEDKCTKCNGTGPRKDPAAANNLNSTLVNTDTT